MDKDVLKMLFKKTFRDLKSSVKQFISIVFIIGIAVTLFVGLQANYSSLKARVNDMYDNGNVADIFLTYDLINEKDKDEENIKNLFPYEYDITSEKRLIMPSKVQSANSNLAITDYFPHIDRASNIYIDDPNKSGAYIKSDILNSNNGEFFLVDRTTVALYNKTAGAKTIKIGTEIPISIDISSSKTAMENTMLANIDQVMADFNPNHVLFSEEQVKNMKASVHKFFTETEFTTINFNAKVTNFMDHPENIASGKNSSPISVLSKKTFLVGLLDDFYNAIHNDYPNITKENIETIYNYAPNRDMYNQILVKFSKTAKVDLPAACDKIRTYFKGKAASTTSTGNMLYLTDLENLPSNVSIQNDIDQAAALSFVFPLVFLLVAVLISITTITQLILKDHNVIGTLKALGLTNHEIMTHYLFTGVTLSLIGCILGCVLGPCIIPYIMDIKYQILYSITSTTYYFPVFAALIMVVSIIVMVSLITIIILGKELHITPAQSMLPQSPRMKMKPRRNSPKIMSFMSLKIALRNIRVYFTKSLMVVIGIMGCTSLLVCGFGIEDTINYGISHDLKMYYDSDISITYSAASSTIADTIKNDTELAKIGTIKEIYPVGVGISTIQFGESGQYNASIYSVNQKTYDDKVFDCTFPANTIMLPKSKAEDLKVSEGDTLNISLNGKVLHKTISIIYERFSMSAIFVHSEDSDFTELYNKPTACFIDVGDSVSVESVEKMGEYITSNISGLSLVITKKQMRDTIEGYVSSVKEMTNTVKIFALLLAVVCLINLALLNFKERMREIATLKVLGFSTIEIAKSLIYEVIILTCVGTIFGLLLGFPMEYLVLSVNQNNLVSFIYYISNLTYGLSAIISVGTALVVNILLSFSIRRVPMVESLKSVE
jgi:ABC-type antimicrobial peptide transport system permease subunit